MQRVGTLLLALLAVAVLGGAVYVIHDNGATSSSSARLRTAPTPASTTPSVAPSAQAAARTPVIAFLGDDWASGAGASARSKSFARLIGAELPVRVKVFGGDGTGYTKTTSTAGDFASRANAVIAAAPDVVMVTGGRNDIDLDAGVVATDAKALFTQLANGLPKAKIIVIAPFWGDSDQPATLTTIAGELKSAAAAAGVTYDGLADPIHGHAGFMADAADPNDAGYAAIAKALEPVVKAALPS